MDKIGYFRFVEGFEKPILALFKAIEEEQHRWSDISNSLVVLPEAFNIGGQYPDKPLGSELPAGEILENLRRELAQPLGIAFIAGIIDGRRNSAYWVDADGQQLMCHKRGDDLTGAYDPYLQNPDPCNPISFDGGCVGALICMDATDDNADIQQRRNDLLTRLKAGKGRKIVCVPAQFRVNRPDPLKFRPVIPDYWYVVADGVYNATSFVARAEKSTSLLQPHLIEATAPKRNEVKLWPLS